MPIEKNHKTNTKWYALSADSILDKLKTSKKGLDTNEVQKRTEKYGPNQLPSKEQDTHWQVFIHQFKSSLVYILLGATLVSLFLKDIVDASIIFLAVIVNVVIGFYQETKVQNSLKALERVVITKAKVLRDGERQEMEASHLVPGDIVYLEAGDKIPADLRLIETLSFKTKESELTGESAEIDKDHKTLDAEQVLAEQTNMGFMGTVVTQGSALGVVVEIGVNTAIGKIAQLVSTTKDEDTPLQKKLTKFSTSLGIVVLVLSFLVFVVGILIAHNFKYMFVTAVAIAVSAIPEGLVVAVTVVLAVGMGRILKRNALVKQLVAAETLGSTQVICADKTGSLTEGHMRVVKIVTRDFNFDLKEKNIAKGAEEMFEVIKAGVYNNNAYITNPHEELEHRQVFGTPTEKALLMAGDEIGIIKNELDKDKKRLDEIPFTSEWKFMMTLHESDASSNIIYIKGAPEKILAFSNYIYTTAHSDKDQVKINLATREDLISSYESLSKEGLRVIALAYKKVPASQNKFDLVKNLHTEFVFLGFMGLKDPLRATAKEMVEITKKAGLETVMITGDHKLTAMAIAKELGIECTEKNIITGDELVQMTESDLVKKVEDIKVYARVTPEDKLKIVKAWQDKGMVVAMTGDGINDAPALKKADIGIALGSGTEVAKETADLVLLDDNFESIVAAVKEGRVVYDNIKKIVLYLLSDSMAEMIIIIFGLLAGWPAPLLASQIIWVNLVDDTLPAMSLTQEPAMPDIMSQKPQEKDKPILDFERKFLIFFISLLGAIGVLFVFWFLWQNYGEASGRTGAFVVLGLSTLMYIFSVRNIRQPIWETKIFSNKFLLFSVLIGTIMQILPVYNPFLQKIFGTVALGLGEWIIIVLACLLIVAFIEITKLLFMKKISKIKI